MNKRRGLALAALASALSGLGGYTWHALAEGAPTRQPLFYAGSLEQDGAAVSGDYTLTLTIHDAASGGNELCSSTSDVRVENGRFRADVSDCADALRAEADSWIGVSFRDAAGVKRDIEGRTKIGAVPYALEAQHAVSASTATGALTAQLAAVEGRLAALEGGGASESAFQAIKRQAQTIDNWAVIAFDDEIFDLGDEYDIGDNTFTTKEGGYYELSCILSWGIGAHDVTAQYEVSLRVNGDERRYAGFTGDGFYATRQVHGLFKLAPGDHVQCAALGEPAGMQPLNVDGVHDWIVFEGKRFAGL